MDRRNQHRSGYPRITGRDSLDVIWVSGEEGSSQKNSLSKRESSAGVEESVMKRASTCLGTIMSH